jgi:hypothetical protein
MKLDQTVRIIGKWPGVASNANVGWCTAMLEKVWVYRPFRARKIIQADGERERKDGHKAEAGS